MFIKFAAHELYYGAHIKTPFSASASAVGKH